MSLEPVDAYNAYSAAWREMDAGARRDLLEQAWSEEGAFFDPENRDGIIGRGALSGYIAETHAEMPGLVVTETSEPEIIGNRLRVSWVARQEGEQTYTGTDFVEFDEDGRVSRLTMFYDSTPD